MAELSVGAAAQHWQWFYQEMGNCRCPPEILSLGHPQVLSISGNRATVDITASLQVEGRTTRITGPMTLLKEGGTWRIASYQRNSEAFPASTALRHAAVSSSDIEV